MMDYRFNYGMLPQWFAANPQMTKTYVAKCLGFTDRSAMLKWINGDRAIPTEHLMKFCNTFQVPLELFFFDNGMTPSMDIRQPSVNDQTEPNAGYVAKNAKGGPHRPSPAATMHVPSIVPERVMMEEETAEVPEETAGTEVEKDATRLETAAVGAEQTADGGTQEANTLIPASDMTHLFLAYQQALADQHRLHLQREDAIREKYEHKWDKEREELMAVIRSQKEALEAARNRNYRYGMVGEE